MANALKLHQPDVPLPAIRLVRSSRFIRRAGQVLMVLLLLTIIGVGFLPWQQTVRGYGKVVAYVPQERQQTVESPIKGVVSSIAPGLVEGSVVKNGDFIVEIEPLIPGYEKQLESQLGDLKAKLEAVSLKADAYRDNVQAFAEAANFAVAAAQQMVIAAEERYQAELNLIAGHESMVWQADEKYKRQSTLNKRGVKSDQELEVFQRELDVAKSVLEAAKRRVEAARQEWESKKNELEQIKLEAQTKVDTARALEQDARSKVAENQKDIRDLELKKRELERLVINAPRDGTIFRMPIFERGQTVKEGDPLFTIVPEAGERAVELWISGNDTPLVAPGDQVRLQFEGWPAIQFAGWPSIARGTFGGVVISVDATDDGKGKFRTLVGPDSDQQWPSNRFLRQGVRASGWVMLRQVSLAYEVWRQLNGFPPVISMDEPTPQASSPKGDTKMPKIPK